MKTQTKQISSKDYGPITIRFRVKMITFLSAVVILASLKCGVSHAQNSAESDVIPPEVVYYDQQENAISHLPLATLDPALDRSLAQLTEVLVQVLQHSGPGGVPMLYVEERPAVEDEMELPEGLASAPWKRSRYYRRYPWKRQNSRSRTYEADNRYMCQPTRDDVFKLLVALHETRAGNGGRSINFCNRRRSAGAIFTNIRFLGRK